MRVAYIILPGQPMRGFGRLCVGLLAGAASTALHAQETAQAAPPAPPKIEFKGADGKPLPPEIQRQLEERFRNDPELARKLAQQAANKDDIVVSAKRPRGSVISDIPPERTLRADDIRAYGANDIQELLQTLGPQVRSERGREDKGPVVLLNGKRVSSLAEIAKIPTEAIERMDVLPEEVALAYGYPADQKVVNVVVFERFTSKVGPLRITCAMARP